MKPSPGWPPASNGSSFPTNSIRSRSSRPSPTIPAASDDVALDSLASIFENRLELDRAADYLKRSIQIFGDNQQSKSRHINQIFGAWGRFEPISTRPAGTGATVDFRFRNGQLVHFEAHEILYSKLLKDVKDYLASRPKQLDWQSINLNDIGSRLVELNQNQYLGQSVARWDLPLEPRPRHFDRRITVTTPLQKAGAICSRRGWKAATQAAS